MQDTNYKFPVSFFEEFFSRLHYISQERCASCGTCRAVRLFPLLSGEEEYSGPLQSQIQVIHNDTVFSIPLDPNYTPLIGRLYPMLLTTESGRVDLKLDTWCPGIDRDALRDEFESNAAELRALLQQIPREFVKSADFLWTNLWKVTELKNLSKRTLSRDRLKDYRIPSISASEAHALYVQDAAWKKLQGTLLYYVQTDFPSPVCHAVRTLLESRDIQLKITSLLKAAEAIAQLSANTLIAHYVELVRSEAVPNPNIKLHLEILTKIRHPSFGTLVGLARDLSKEYLRMGISHFAEELPQAWSGEVSELMGEIVTQRNRIQHHKIELTAENAGPLFDTLFEYFLKIVHQLRFLRNYAIVAPAERRGDTYDMWAARGIGHAHQFWQHVHPAGDVSIGRVALLDMTSMRVMSLWPFYRVEHTKDSVASIIRAEFKDAKRVDYVDEINATHRTVVMESEDFPAFLEPLSPDYIYQSRAYLKGFPLREIAHAVTCEIINPFGDLFTCEKIHLQKIKHETTTDQDTDRYSFDYHDSPYFPVDDETFNLQVLIEDVVVPESRIVKTIWNPGFRKFGVDLGKRLELGEELHLKVSFFEPELMELWPVEIDEEFDDYYEITPTVPCDQFTFTLIFPIGYTPYNVVITQVDGEKLKPGKCLRHITVKSIGDGRKKIEYTLMQPAVDTTYILQYHLQRPPGKPDYPLPMTLFQAGRNVYETMLQAGTHRRWNVKHKNGKIILEPVDKSETYS